MLMSSKDRIKAVLNFKSVDRLPFIEWAPYWNETIESWKKKGMPSDVTASKGMKKESIRENENIRNYFGLDGLTHIWVNPRAKDCPKPAKYGHLLIKDEKDYENIKKYLYHEPAVDPKELERIAMAQQEEGAGLWFTFEGFFWHPRMLFGIEEHMYAFYDYPELMNRINEDNMDFLFRLTEEICRYTSPQFMSFAEDMSYNRGPMISKVMFDEFLAPFYKKSTEFLRSKGIKCIVDSDGLVDEPVDWYKEVGMDGFLPLEKHAGVDIVKYRKKYPDLLLIGGFDKLCMSRGEEAMREEFERILPVMKQGGYIPGVDHQTPPEVSLEDYRLYLKLLKEYCEKAVI